MIAAHTFSHVVEIVLIGVFAGMAGALIAHYRTRQKERASTMLGFTYLTRLAELEPQHPLMGTDMQFAFNPALRKMRDRWMANDHYTADDARRSGDYADAGDGHHPDQDS